MSKKPFGTKSTLLAILFVMTQFSFAQIIKQDSIKSICITGAFTGRKNKIFDYEVYKINEYCIFSTDISEKQLDSLKRTKVIVFGELKIVEEIPEPSMDQNDGKIYELYQPPILFIINPTFTILNKNYIELTFKKRKFKKRK